MRASLRVVVAVLMASAVGACQLPDSSAPHPGVVCTLIAVAALNVTVTDSLTSAAIANAKVVARLQDASYADSTSSSFGGLYALAYERAGAFDVTVQAPGYFTWSRPQVVVVKTPEGCHVIPVALAARMVKG